MQPMPMTTPQQQQNNLAAMMWQMQMAPPNPAAMMPPWGPPAMPMAAPMLNVRVDGLTFEYQLTEDDVRKVFSRYGDVYHVNVDKEGTTAQVQLGQYHQTVAAQHDLDKKQLAGMQGAYLRVEFATPLPYDPMLAQMAAAVQQTAFAGTPMLPAGLPGYPTPPLQIPSPPQAANQPKKCTCKLEVGIENDSEFRVGSRVIQIARQIWQDPKFQEHGGKTRLRGKGIGGPHEADEPLALCISCRDQLAFDKAVRYAETQLQKVHTDYKDFCTQEGRSVPELAVKISRSGSFLGDGGSALGSNTSMPRGERPQNAPTDEEIESLIEERNEARKAANFKKADELREYLKSRGVVLMDDKGAKGNLNGNEVTKWRFWRP